MPYLLVMLTAIVAAIGFTKIGTFKKPSRMPWGLLLVWALLVAVELAIWVSATRIG
jgi:hypothetical protein